MKNNTTSRAALKVAILLLVLLVIYSQRHKINGFVETEQNTTIENKEIDKDEGIVIEAKQRGAHVFGIGDSTDFQPFADTNIEWITMVSWGFQDRYDSPNVTHHNGDSIYMKEHNKHWSDRIKLVREAGFKVFFKPHLWIDDASDGKWRADIYPTSEENWITWQETYRNFILRYAQVAEDGQADMFCIGAEFSLLTAEKPLFWKDLIREIKSIYSGKITYASNWYDEYEKITFWDQLDYIGIQAYFPLAENENPTIEEVAAGWNSFLPAMEAVSKKQNKKILFTEMGYKSTSNSAIRPWEWIENPSELSKDISLETQANCYEAFFNTVWKKDWFAGVHIWQLRTDYKTLSKYDSLDFTPQLKPAEGIITQGFK